MYGPDTPVKLTSLVSDSNSEKPDLLNLRLISERLKGSVRI